MQLISLYKKSYSGLSRETWILALVTLVNRSGMMVLPFMTLYLTTAKHFSIAQAGIVASFFGLGSMTGSYAGGWLSDRIGYFRVQLISLIFGGIALVVLGYLDGFIPICAGMYVSSSILDMLRPAMSASITSFADKGNMTRSFSLIRMAINLGAGIGPAFAGILAGYDFRLIFVADGLTSIASGIVLYFYFRHRIKNDKIEKKKTSFAASPLLNPWYAAYLLFCLLYAVIFFQLFCTLPLFYEHVHNLTKKMTGLLIAMNGLIVFVFEMILVFKLENSFHPRKIIMSGILIGGIGLILLNIVDASWILIVSMALLSFSEILAMPFMMSVAVSKSNSTNRGLYTGTYSVAWSAAFILAPILGTFVVTHFGYANLWWSMGILSLLTLTGIYFIIPKIYDSSQHLTN